MSRALPDVGGMAPVTTVGGGDSGGTRSLGMGGFGAQEAPGQALSDCRLPSAHRTLADAQCRRDQILGAHRRAAI